MESGKLLTSDVARILDCSTDNVRLLERSGKLHADKTAGGVRLFDRKSVEQFARDRASRLETRGRRR
jgi:DNA-binding transcriptional MerR regulator